MWKFDYSIYDILFTTYSTMKYYNKKKVGTKITKVNKTIFGISEFCILILFLIIPLLLFSVLNPFTVDNLVTGMLTKFYICFKQGNTQLNFYFIY